MWLLLSFWVPLKHCCEGQSWCSKFWGKHPFAPFGVLWVFFFCVSSLAYLQPLQLEKCAVSPSISLQLKHVGVQERFPVSGESFCRWLPPHHMQWGGCLQFAQTCPNFWQLEHCISIFWDLYGSTLIAMWQRFGKVKISYDFIILGKVMRNNGWLTAVVPSTSDRR